MATEAPEEVRTGKTVPAATTAAGTGLPVRTSSGASVAMVTLLQRTGWGFDAVLVPA